MRLGNNKYLRTLLIGVLVTALIYLLLSLINQYADVFAPGTRLLLSTLLGGYLTYRFLYAKL